MSKKIRTPAALAAAFAVAASLAGSAHAAGTQAITTQNAWVRWLPNNLPSAAYVTLVNASDKPVDLVDISSDDYGSTMLHQTVSNGSTQKMIMADKLTVPARGTAAIAPGRYHVMLGETKHKIAPRDTVHLQLKFSDGETLDTPFAVKSPSQTK